MLVLVLVGGWFWGRDSWLVAIRQVGISGVTGPDAARIDAALRRTATTMTTLDFDLARLRASVARFGEVRSITASTSFPHGLTIQVDTQLPVAQVNVGGHTLVVAGDGKLLRSAAGHAGPLPVIPLAGAPLGARLSEPRAAAAVRVLAAAPWQLLAHIRRATSSAAHGVIASLRGGPSIYFGDSRDLHAKWLAALAVLASPRSLGASYIDVTDPGRPAAGVPVTPPAPPGEGGAAGALMTTTTSPTSASPAGNTSG
jgi:cell division protein FtsQ